MFFGAGAVAKRKCNSNLHKKLHKWKRSGTFESVFALKKVPDLLRLFFWRAILQQSPQLVPNVAEASAFVNDKMHG